MQRISSTRHFKRVVITVVLLLVGAFECYGEDTYNGTQLTTPSLVIGNATYTNVVVTPLAILSVQGGTAVGSVDSYNPANNELTIPAVFYSGRTYTNVVITVGSLVSVGSVYGADFYNSQELNIPSVQVLGGSLFNNVIATVSGILSYGGGMPANAQDVYDPATKQLTIAAIQLGTQVYTNAVVTIGTVVSVGASPLNDTLLYSFDGPTIGNPGNAVGGQPGGLIQASDGNFYGTASEGGAGNGGTLFRMTPAGAVSVIHSFGSVNGDGGPPAGLIQGTDGNLYGTSQGGAYGQGAVYKITTAGLETVLYSFNGSPDGAGPTAGLIQGSDGNFYGTTSVGGNETPATVFGAGTVFKVTPTGVETVLYAFSGSPDGAKPNGGLVVGDDGNYYGTTASGGTNNAGTVFRITPAGAETVLYSFAGGAGDGAGPAAGLVRSSDGNFYGTTQSGGFTNAGDTAGGSVFQITPTGVETVLHFFSGNALSDSLDGALPAAALIQGSDGNFYGTTAAGGESNWGTVFKITPSGLASVLHSFGQNTRSDGVSPEASLVQSSDGSLYGTTEGGGSYLDGTVFKLSKVIAPP